MRAKDDELSHFDHCLRYDDPARTWRSGRDAVGLMSLGEERRWLSPSKGTATMSRLLRTVYDLEAATSASTSGAAEELSAPASAGDGDRADPISGEEDLEDLLPAVRLLRRTHYVQVCAEASSMASWRTIRRPSPDAFATMGAQRHDLEHRRVHERLRGAGLRPSTYQPDQLGSAIVNRYYEVKQGGSSERGRRRPAGRSPRRDGTRHRPPVGLLGSASRRLAEAQVEEGARVVSSPSPYDLSRLSCGLQRRRRDRGRSPRLGPGRSGQPLYRGFCCVKGRNMAAVQQSPRRLLLAEARRRRAARRSRSSRRWARSPTTAGSSTSTGAVARDLLGDDGDECGGGERGGHLGLPQGQRARAWASTRTRSTSPGRWSRRPSADAS
ncbi:MAG: hypothetical protein R3E53_11000 [Myxococcota bacterium]